jgi:hypothetical protein
LHLTCDDGEPRSFAEAEKHAAWHNVIQSEMDAVEKNRIWELADLPRDHIAITLKWMFKLKSDEVGAIITLGGTLGGTRFRAAERDRL